MTRRLVSPARRQRPPGVLFYNNTVTAETSLANITDGFTGQAPDLGALEVGQPAPIYGPSRH